jgi:UDP-glucose 4-epimerase
VTGGCGFIGQHLVHSLLSDSTTDNHHLVVVDNLSNGTKKNPFGKESEVVFYKKDVRDSAMISQVIKKEKVDTCVHLAAKVIYSDSQADALEVFDVNVMGTLSVLKACEKSHVKNFVFASSAAVYGEPQILPTPETHPLNPMTVYGASKVAAENLIRAFTNSGKIKNSVILRIFNVYGEGQTPAYAGVITKFAERLSKGLPPVIFGDGTQSRDFVSIRDVVDALILATWSPEVYGTFNIGTGRAVTLNQLAASMIEAFGVKLEAIHTEHRVGDVIHSCADMSIANKHLKFKAKEKLELALKLPLNYHRSAKLRAGDMHK